MFTLPSGQVMVSNAAAGRPQARGDLAALMRLSMESICTSFGVPATMVLESKFAAGTHAEMELMNSTIRSFAKVVSDILSQTYTELYNDVDTRVELCANQVVVTEELVKLRKSGLLPVEVGMPRALRALGVAEEGVQRYVAAAVEREAKRKRISD